jgi:hypothetical protein
MEAVRMWSYKRRPERAMEWGLMGKEWGMLAVERGRSVSAGCK